jgi:hypothetical protein
MKTVNLTPTWEAALNICTMALQRSVSDVKSRRAKNDLESRIIMLRDTFLPLCRAMDVKNEEIRKQNEEREAMSGEELTREDFIEHFNNQFVKQEEKPTVCPECADTLPCGHAEIDEEAKCALCGGEGP